MLLVVENQGWRCKAVSLVFGGLKVQHHRVERSKRTKRTAKNVCDKKLQVYQLRL